MLVVQWGVKNQLSSRTVYSKSLDSYDEHKYQNSKVVVRGLFETTPYVFILPLEFDKTST